MFYKEKDITLCKSAAIVQLWELFSESSKFISVSKHFYGYPMNFPIFNLKVNKLSKFEELLNIFSDDKPITKIQVL